jgi:hypothetical protein
MKKEFNAGDVLIYYNQYVMYITKANKTETNSWSTEYVQYVYIRLPLDSLMNDRFNSYGVHYVDKQAILKDISLGTVLHYPVVTE